MSPRRVALSLICVARRFPLALLFVAFFAAVSFAFVDATVDDSEQRTWFFLFFYSATGTILALALALWSETVRRRPIAIAVQAVVHGIWLLASLYLSAIVVHDLDVTYVYASVALSLLVVAALFLLPFVREDDDRAMCLFSQRFIGWVAGAVIISGVLDLGLSLLFLSFNKLFNVAIDYDVYEYVFVFCFALLCPLLVLQQIPSKDAVHQQGTSVSSPFFSGVIHYLYVPLLGAYLLTLYAYAAKILLAWQLPVGWVSSLVSCLIVAMLLLLYLLYPARFAEGRRFDKKLLRWLPLLVIPLLVLMSVAIGRRISDYGITNARLYLAVFNIWSYLACIGLALSGSRRLWWVFASFVAIGLVVTVGPQSIACTVRRSMVESITQSMARQGFTRLPLDTEASQWMSQLSDKEAETMQSKLRYLRNSYDESVVGGLVHVNMLSNVLGFREKKQECLLFDVRDSKQPISIPKGAKRVLCTVYTDNVNVSASGTVVVTVHYDEQQASFTTTADALRKHSAKESPLALYNKDKIYIVSYYMVSIDGSFSNMQGELFFLK